ncbi:MAG: Flp family type IVb pilin [Alphaproteobacteria bacterium]
MGLLVGRKGATAVEYSILPSGIAIVIVAGVLLIGSNLAGFFNLTAVCFQDFNTCNTP